MVLENASAQDDFNDGAPASDSDPYGNSSISGGADSTGRSIEYNINTNGFPKPLPIIGPLLGYNDALYAKTLHARLEGTSRVINRPITEDEANALAYYTAKQLSINSYGTPVGLLGAFYRARSTTDRFRFPFYQPNLDTFPKESFPSAKLAYVTGPRATMLWHMLRWMAYGAFGSYASNIFFASYGMSVTAVGELGDKRLKDVVKALQKVAQNRRGQIPSKPRQPGGEDGVQEQNASTAWRGQQNGSEDDASPTGGAYGVSDEVSNRIGAQSDDSSAELPRTGQWPSRPVPRSPSPQEEEPRSAPVFFGGENDDDASPTGGRGMRDDTTKSQSGGGSAWDRVRRQADTQSPGSRQSAWSKIQSGSGGEQERGRSKTGDSFTFSNNEEDKQLAREEAQKEFDARVERERHGGDFTAKGDQKRW